MMKIWISRAFMALGLFALVLTTSCSKDDIDDDTNVELVNTQIPNDVTQLFVEKGNINSNKVVLYSNGGPDFTLDSNYFDELGFSEYHEVYVHQSNTFNPSIINSGNLTFERAIEENENSVDILHQVAQHFSDQGKEVYIVGHSFGAILIPSLIATKEPIATKYLLLAGRLDFPDVVWQGFRSQQSYYFENGVTPTEQFLDGTVSEVETKRYYARMKLQAGFGQYRYTQLLQNKDLSNVIYAYGDKDEAVGSLTTDEVNFLNSKDATVYAIQGGSHDSMTESPHTENLKGLLFEE
ncbi:alpha/beta hydrolase [Aequorivita marina]|uniref:alpha/beta hydrolase n=1 Tax=Aequorivita marina TaxID=3073654 RepID=UPI002875156C|nr:alpha/beta hydrolase [Aequorivita sp. S2608]MDS1297376.1 alpha/beta hydrolase [Aequorivita sp. S2608]